MPVSGWSGQPDAEEETGAPRGYTARAGVVNATALDPAAGVLDLPADLAAGTVRRADGSEATLERRADGGVDVVVPEMLRGDAAAGVSITVEP